MDITAKEIADALGMSLFQVLKTSDEYEKLKNELTSINEDIEIVKGELVRNDIKQILYTDLTRPELDVSVVRVIIPEMELYALDQTRAGYRFLKVW